MAKKNPTMIKAKVNLPYVDPKKNSEILYFGKDDLNGMTEEKASKICKSFFKKFKTGKQYSKYIYTKMRKPK